jgi:hypothetical protein
MPLGPFPFPDFATPPPPAREPSPWARMWARWRRNQLDDELSAGADPRASAEAQRTRVAASIRTRADSARQRAR